jgi:hypothetical protein
MSLRSRLPIVFFSAVAALAILGTARPAEAQYGAAYLTRRLGELQTQYAVGMSQWGPAQTGNLRAGARRSFDFVLPSGACYKFIAVGDADIRDLDLYIARGGQQVARDTATDNFPVASYCATVESRVSVEIKAVTGRGEFAFAIYQGAAGSVALTQVSNPAQNPALLGPQGQTAQGQVNAQVQVNAPPAQGQHLGTAPPSDPLSRRVMEIAGHYATGARLVGSVKRGAASRGSSVNYAYNLVPGHCYTVIVAGSPSATDIDLFLFDPNRRRVASDREANNLPHLSHCASMPAAYRLEVKMHRGDGPFALGVFDAQGGAAPAPVAPVAMPPRPAAPAGPDPLLARLTEVSSAVAPGAAPVSQVFRGAGETHARVDYSVNLEPGRCYTFIAVGSPSVTDLDLYVFDPNRRRVTSDRERNNFPHVTHCAGMPAPYTVRVQMYRGSGPYVMQVFGQ